MVRISLFLAGLTVRNTREPTQHQPRSGLPAASTPVRTRPSLSPAESTPVRTRPSNTPLDELCARHRLAANDPRCATPTEPYEPVLCSERCVDVRFVAHQDDDLLFVNPDIAASLAAGNRVVTVFVTAGTRPIPRG
jgi:hypothetical protein